MSSLILEEKFAGLKIEGRAKHCHTYFLFYHFSLSLSCILSGHSVWILLLQWKTVTLHSWRLPDCWQPWWSNEKWTTTYISYRETTLQVLGYPWVKERRKMWRCERKMDWHAHEYTFNGKPYFKIFHKGIFKSFSRKGVSSFHNHFLFFWHH